jgi:hypothetical protein
MINGTGYLLYKKEEETITAVQKDGKQKQRCPVQALWKT